MKSCKDGMNECNTTKIQLCRVLILFARQARGAPQKLLALMLIA